MNQKLFHSLSRNWTLIAIILFLLITTPGLIWLQYLQVRDRHGTKIPINSGISGTTGTGPETLIGKGDSTGMPEETKPISIKLSEGKAQPQAIASLPLAQGDPLSEDEVAAVLTRLPELQGEAGDQTEFKLPPELLPPPRPGDTVKETFPPAAPAVQPDETSNEPLKVLRYSPEGSIPIAPFLSVTFNQPMVALDTLEDLSAAEVPLQLEPVIPGTWRWLGTRTLTFQSDSTEFDRLPKATVYTATVPAGTKSVSGNSLAAAVSWTFSTPPVQITNSYPSGEGQPLEPVIFIHFDQRIHPAAVLETVRVTAGGNPVTVELVNEETAAKDDGVKNLLESAVAGRWMAFRPMDKLPADTDVIVTAGPGTPSAEGPLTTDQMQSFGFHTYAPLRIEDHGCSWGGDRCQPLTPFYLRFNNPIDTSLYTEELLSIEPALNGAAVNVYGNNIEIQGESKGQTTYIVTVSANIQDIYGQKLGSTQRLTFRVGPAEPSLVGPGANFVTLDPAAMKPGVSIYTVNYPRLNVRIYAVQPSDWPAFKQYLRDWQRTDIKVTVPGRKVFDKAVPIEAAADTLTESTIDLSPVMDGKFGQFIVIVEPPKGLFENDENHYRQTVQTWAQVTQIGLDAYTDHSEMVAWTTRLTDGVPLAETQVTSSTGTQVTTGADGTVRFPIPDGATYLVAKQGADQAILPRDTFYWNEEGWYRRNVSDELRWFVFDDRQMYRPGEVVHVKGWLRQIGGKQDGDVSLPGASFSGLNYQVTDSLGNAFFSGQAKANALGGFDFSFTIPDQINLGYSQIMLNAEGSLANVYGQQYSHTFRIEEFRRPEFEVNARNETTGPYFAGGSAVVAVKANYYAGGPLPGAAVDWQVTSNQGSYSPPNWPEFNFGTWTPWWWYGGYKYDRDFSGEFGQGGTVEIFSGQTDGAGEHFLNLDFDQGGDPHPLSVVAQATVMDVNRQAWTGSTSLLVHPAELYVGMRSEPYFVEKNTPIKVDVIVTDLDGNPVVDRPVEVKAERMEWKVRNGQWGEEAVDPQVCKIGSKSEPVSCTFNTPVGGSYRITATVSDSQGRKNQSRFNRWVSGGEIPPARNVEQEQVTLIPDKESYQPGDTARILVQSPFSPAEGLLSVNRSGLLYTERFRIEDGTATLSIPIEAAYIPNISIQVDVNGAAQRMDDQGEPLVNAPLRPAFATAQMTLNIPPLQRTLALEVTPEQTELEPGEETTLKLTLKDANGSPVEGAELAVIVVDEAVLALSGYDLTDPMSVFYTQRGADWSSVYSRSNIILTNPEVLAQVVAQDSAAREAKSGEGMLMEAPAAAPMATMAAEPEMMKNESGAAGSTNAPIRVRIDFNPLAMFAPEVTTDANGEATVAIKLPDNLTRYRVMVAAVDSGGRKFGKGEANMTARLPLMVRPSAPRFLNFGDRFDLPVVLQNQTDEPMIVDVVVRTSNLALNGDISAIAAVGMPSMGARVTVPARDRIEVRFPTETMLAGTARIQVAAVSGGYADAANVELPVYTPATTEAFATYGVIDDGAIAQPVGAPQNVFAQYGGLEITTSSTALQALTDAVIYLVDYPYDCSEQIASRVLGIASLRDVLSAFQSSALPSPAVLEASVNEDLAMLQTIQNEDGGVPYWRRGQESVPYNTIHVAHALAAAKEKGFSVPAELEQRTLEYLRQIENYYPSYYSQETRWTLSAYALNVRRLMNDRDPAKALKIISDAGLDRLSLDAIGWLWPVIQDSAGSAERLDEIRLLVGNRVVETAGAANFTNTYDDQNYLLLGSDRRTDAILLDALMLDNPEADLIPKIVNGLLAHREKGRWMNTQENVFILLALDHYFNKYEAQTPDFVARIWLGETYAGSHEFRGRTTERSQTDIPMAYLVDPALGGGVTQDLVLSKEGAGRLYYRLGLRYAPTSLAQGPLDMGFVVQRIYEGVDNPDDVRLADDGTWHIKAGARVRVRLTMQADNRRYHVALVDPVAAGLEIINPALAVSGTTPADPNSPDRPIWWWWGPWFQHQNLRDQRAEAFTALLWEGVYQYSYVTRATTPGTFVVPPAKAEEMYSPETFGRSGSNIVIIE